MGHELLDVWEKGPEDVPNAKPGAGPEKQPQRLSKTYGFGSTRFRSDDGESVVRNLSACRRSRVGSSLPAPAALSGHLASLLDDVVLQAPLV